MAGNTFLCPIFIFLFFGIFSFRMIKTINLIVVCFIIRIFFTEYLFLNWMVIQFILGQLKANEIEWIFEYIRYVSRVRIFLNRDILIEIQLNFQIYIRTFVLIWLKLKTEVKSDIMSARSSHPNFRNIYDFRLYLSRL